jgi:hypothetical protein
MDATNNTGSSVKKTNGASSGKLILKTELVRNITSNSEKSYGSSCFSAVIKPHEILKLGTSKNLRRYIAEHKDGKRNLIHKQIGQTLEANADRFIQLNSGFTIVTDAFEISDGFITLYEPSIVNGGQSQGEVARFLNLYELSEADPYANFDTRCEIIVEADQDWQTEIAIARNTTTKVQSVSQAGARKHLDDLSASMQKYKKDYKINKSETDEGSIDTMLLLQVTRLFMPDEIRSPSNPDNISDGEILKSYRAKSKCLEEFSDSFHKKDDKYNFFVNFAPKAWDAYLTWKAHPQWVGTGLQQKYGNKNDKKTIGTRVGGNGAWRDMVPGVIFPVLYGLHSFVEETSPGNWELNIPDMFDVERYLKTAKSILTSDCSYDPMVMGRSIGAYNTLSENPRSLKAAIEAVRKHGGYNG